MTIDARARSISALSQIAAANARGRTVEAQQMRNADRSDQQRGAGGARSPPRARADRLPSEIFDLGEFLGP